ncbi:MAG: hypothetical protein NTX50_15175 [Candidatus Sumerlaeota bacterium]|nr:hypothetical protein [Candidatus Sumerlaeota bacterium]
MKVLSVICMISAAIAIAAMTGCASHEGKSAASPSGSVAASAPSGFLEGYAATAAKRAKAAVVDGVAGKDEYPSLALPMKQTPERETIQTEPASARVFHDGKMLYVAMTVPIKKISELSKGETWGTNDGGEVCFRDASGAQPGATFVIHGFASGKHECTTDGGASSDDASKLEKAVKFAATIGAQSWTGEWAIPLEAAGIRYKPGMTLGFNLGLWRSEGSEWNCWRGAQGATYQLESAGTLTLE